MSSLMKPIDMYSDWFFVLFFLATEYSYLENSCVTHIRTPDFSGTGLPSWYFPVGAIQLRYAMIASYKMLKLKLKPWLR